MNIAGIILSDIYSDGLVSVTKGRTVASLPFGGRYRQVDFILSNMVNSGISDIGLVTKHNYQSLIDHLGSYQDWDLNRKRGGLKLIPPYASGTSGSYRGKIEELRASLDFLRGRSDDYVVVADTYHLCNIDLRKVIAQHVKSGVDLTVVVAPVTKEDGILSELVLDSKNGVDPTGLYIDYPAREGQYVSIGMYVVSRRYLISVVEELAAKGLYHLERDFIQWGFNRGTVRIGLYEFTDLFLQNRTVREYFENSLLVSKDEVRTALFRPEAPIYTTVRDEVPTFYGTESFVSDCTLADGCSIEGRVENSNLFRGVTVGKGAVVRNSVLMSGCTVGENAWVENVIMDKDASVGPGKRLIGSEASPKILGRGEKA